MLHSSDAFAEISVRSGEVETGISTWQSQVGKGLLTVIGEHVKCDDGCREVDEVEEEVTVVVDADAVVDPWAMAGGAC